MESMEVSEDPDRKGESSQPTDEKQQLEQLYNTQAEPETSNHQSEKVSNESEETPPPTYSKSDLIR